MEHSRRRDSIKMKMIKKIIAIIVLCLLAVGSAAAQAPTEGQVTYLLDAGQNDLIFVNADGSAQSVPLGLGENEFISQSDMVVSEDGNLLAFCKYLPSEDQTLRTLVMRDLQAETNVWTREGMPMSGCRPGAFSPDGQLLAVGFAEDSLTTSNPDAWSLELLNTSTGETVHALEGSSDALPDFTEMTEFGFEEGFTVMPDVQHLNADTVIFWAVPFIGRDAPGQFPAISWNYQSGDVQQVEGWGHLNLDYLPATGELAYSMLDESQAAAVPSGPLPQANAVVVRDASGAETVVYRNSDWIVMDVTFVNNGRQLAVQLLSALDQSDPSTGEMSSVRYELVSRDGTVTQVPGEYQSATSIANADGGAWLYWTDHDPMQPDPPIAHVDYFNGTDLQSIWVQTPPESEIISFYNLLWTPPPEPASNLQPFAAQ
jgi:hypothetical protein